MRVLFKSSLFLAVLGAASIVSFAQQAPPAIRLVSTPWSPFTNVPGQPRFALDLVEAALGRAGQTANTTIVEPAQFTTSLLSGQYDGSASAWKDTQRERALLYSQPYLENRLILVGRRGSDVSATTLAALKGKKVAIVEGYSYGDNIEASGPTFVRSKGEEDSMSLLLKSTVDYTLMDELIVQYILTHYEKEAATRLQVGSTALLKRELHLAISRARVDAASIVNKFNAQLRSMMTDGTYHRLLQVDWIQADVDGDGVSEYVPASDRPGPNPPQRAYSLFTAEQPPQQKPNTPQRFWVGGSIYNSWTAVPDFYKVTSQSRPDPARSAANIFNFTW